MPRSVVTGAAGFIGSHICDRLLAMGHDVVGVDCFTDYYARPRKERNLEKAREHDAFSFRDADLLDTDLRALLDGADYVFHQAGQAGVRPSWGAHFVGYLRNNIEATQHLLEAAKDADITKLVFASSSSVYGNADELPVTERALPKPVSPYGVTKLAAEHLCSLYAANYGLAVVSLRYFTVYGPRQRPDMAIQRFLSACITGETVTLYGDGTQTRDFTFVGDAVEANILAMDADESSVVNVCGGSTISMNDLIALIEATTDHQLNLVHEDAAWGDAKHTYGDNSLARRLLGFTPNTELADGVAAHWRWLQEQDLS